VGTGKTFELLASERNLLAHALGEQGANGTQQVSSRFIRVPVWLNEKKWNKQKRMKMFRTQSSSSSSSVTSLLSLRAQQEMSEMEEDALMYRNIPCLYSEATGKNVFLVAANSEEWRELQSGTTTGPKLVELLNGKIKCPLPVAGQKGMTSSSAAVSSFIGVGNTSPEVSFIIPMHDHVELTLRCLLNILRFADEVPSAEVMLHTYTYFTNEWMMMMIDSCCYILDLLSFTDNVLYLSYDAFWFWL
jgi:hypothetical protein